MKGLAEELMPGSLKLSSRSWMKQTTFRYSICPKIGFALHQAVFVLQFSCAFSSHCLARQRCFRYKVAPNKSSALPHDVPVKPLQQELDEADQFQVKSVAQKWVCITSGCFCPSILVCLQQSL